jgi:hypothetical protein
MDTHHTQVVGPFTLRKKSKNEPASDVTGSFKRGEVYLLWHLSLLIEETGISQGMQTVLIG